MSEDTRRASEGLRELEHEARKRAIQKTAHLKAPTVSARWTRFIIFVLACGYGLCWGWAHFAWRPMFDSLHVGDSRDRVLLHMGPPTATRRPPAPWQMWWHQKVPPDAGAAVARIDFWTSPPPGRPHTYHIEYDENGNALILKGDTSEFPARP